MHENLIKLLHNYSEQKIEKNRNKYKYMELVPYFLTNRGQYLNSKDTISFSFENPYVETWRSMFLYENNKPTEEDKMVGNFYIECDIEDFNLNKKIMIEVCDYLNNTYKLPYNNMFFFMTNRSLWLEIPYKTFGIYPQKKLNRVYREMGREVNNYIKRLFEIRKALDTGIYKWNGLIHSLGSYLPKVKRWVTKFEYNDLINCNSMEEIKNCKWDYGYNYDYIETIEECREWFKLYYKKVNYSKYKFKSPFKNYSPTQMSKSKMRKLINKIKELDFEEGMRNNAIFSYSLALKHIGYEKEDIIEEILEWVKEVDRFYYLTERKEILRTIMSAMKGKYKISYSMIEELFGIKIEKENEEEYQHSFVIPRKVIKKLNKKGCHWKCYKIMIDMYYDKKVLKCDYYYNLKGEKYKKNIQAYFETLQEIGLICYTRNKDEINAYLCDNYDDKGYIIMPNTFIESKKYKNMKKEIVVFMEIMNSCYITKRDMHYSNILIKTIGKNIKSTIPFVLECLELLQKNNIIYHRYVIFGYKVNKQFIREALLIRKRKSCIMNEDSKLGRYMETKVKIGNTLKTNCTSKQIFLFLKNHKMIYSLNLNILDRLDISTFIKNGLKNICGIDINYNLLQYSYIY